MYNFDRMIVQAEMDYRGKKLLRGARPKRGNRFAESHHESSMVSREVAKHAR